MSENTGSYQTRDEDNRPDVPGRQRPLTGKRRFVILSLLPALLMVGIAEIALRMLDVDKPVLHSKLLSGEVFGFLGRRAYSLMPISAL
jgi:hypothetical protein